MKSSRSALAVLGLGLLFYLFTIRPGQRAGDFAMYVQHAANLVDGESYAATTYVQNPDAVSIGTTFYPPGLPLIIAPLYAFFGLSLTPAKILMVVLFFAALVVFGLTVERRLAWPFLTLMMVDLAFTPYFWEYKDNVAADYPFLFFAFITLFLVSQVFAEDEDSMRRADPFKLLWIGISIYIAIATRAIGLSLLVAILLLDVAQARRPMPTRRFWLPAGVVVVLMAAQLFILPSNDNTYLAGFLERMNNPADIVGSVVHNFKYYLLAVTGRTLMSNGFGTWWSDALLVLCLIPFAIGFWRRVREGLPSSRPSVWSTPACC